MEHVGRNMKEKIAAFLVNLVSIVDIFLIRVRNRRERSGSNSGSIVLVRLDAIGDFIMWLDSAKEFRHCSGGKQKIILICNQVCYDIAESTGYFDQVIGLNYGKLRHTSQVGYRWSVHRILKGIRADQAVQCTYSREIFSDMVMSAVQAKEKVTIDSPGEISCRWTYRLAQPIYQQVISTPGVYMMEIRRNSLFTGKVLHRQIRPGIPELRPVAAAQGKVPEGNYYILFLGASETERMWPTERFAQVAEQLQEDVAYHSLKCCICGGRDEVYLYEKFLKQYPHADRVLNRVGNTSLLELIEVIRGAKFIITNDTSAVHFAAAVNTPAVCIWGPWEYGRFLPYDVETEQGRCLPQVCYHDMPCRNCLLYQFRKTNECKTHIEQKGIRYCLDQVQAEEVIRKVKCGEVSCKTL